MHLSKLTFIAPHFFPQPQFLYYRGKCGWKERKRERIFCPSAFYGGSACRRKCLLLIFHLQSLLSISLEKWKNTGFPVVCLNHNILCDLFFWTQNMHNFHNFLDVYVFCSVFLHHFHHKLCKSAHCGCTKCSSIHAEIHQNNIWIIFRIALEPC